MQRGNTLQKNMERDSFVFYRSWYDAIGNLPRDIQGEVLTTIIEYGLSGVTTENLKPITRAIMELIKPQINANNARFENGKMGGAPKKKPKENQNETKTQPKENQNETKAKPNVYDNVNVNVNVNTDSRVRTHETTESVSQFLEFWNSQPSLAACAALSKTDTVNLQRIVSEWGWARVRDVVAYAAATPTLNGTSASGFQACAAWFLKPERFAEIATAAERAALRGNAQAEKEAYAQRQLEIEKAEQKRLNEARERAAASAVPMPDECENLKRLFTKTD